MKKHFARAAFAYAALAMVFGVFYREFTKFSGFTGQTTLSVMHPHYFLLGMVFCLVMLIAEQLFSFMPAGKGGKILALYHVGLNVTCLGLFLRGLAQVQGMALSRGLDASLSGIAGMGMRCWASPCCGCCGACTVLWTAQRPEPCKFLPTCVL